MPPHGVAIHTVKINRIVPLTVLFGHSALRAFRKILGIGLGMAKRGEKT